MGGLTDNLLSLTYLTKPSHRQLLPIPPTPQTYKQQGNTVLKLGDTVIPYHEDFRMYITTKMPNPHYTPEIATKLTLINFTLSPR